MKRERFARLCLGLAAATMVVIGCGGEESKVAKSEAPLRVPAEQSATVAAAVANVTTAPEEAEVVALVDSLSPELAVEVEEGTFDPGEAVEITALGSPDVREVILSDGLGKTTSFVYDLPAKAWKAYYRVPMKPRGERLGLSVTAKNGGHRWRRVWLFLKLQSSTISTVSGPAPADSIR